MATPIKQKHYDPGMSKTPDSKLQAYVRTPIQSSPIQGHVIPGLGSEGSKSLKSAGINSEKELIELFVSIKKSGMSNQQHCDAMYNWLASHGINSHRHEIIQAVSGRTDQLKMVSPGKHSSNPPAGSESEQLAAEEGSEFNWGGIIFLMAAILAALYFKDSFA